MNINQVREVKKLCKEVTELCQAVEVASNEHGRKEKEYDRAMNEYRSDSSKPYPYLASSDPFYGSKQTSALRRRSMDLTRALAELRR